MGDQDITEVPAALKRLAKYLVHGFYGVEYALAFNVLICYPCVKEDDLFLLLKYEHKQLHTVLNTLKADKFVKLQMCVETGPNGKSTRHNYYYINYKMLVDVVKYKLDHMRQKIEAGKQDSTTCSSFKCPSCLSTYTDIGVNQLFDIFTNMKKVDECFKESATENEITRTLLIHEYKTSSVTGHAPPFAKSRLHDSETDTSKTGEEAKVAVAKTTASNLENEEKLETLNQGPHQTSGMVPRAVKKN